MARVIYEENTFYQPDQDAIMWIIVNRMITTYYEGNTILEKAYSIVITPNQFDGLRNKNAMQSQNVSDSGWHRAVYLACALEIATGLEDIKIAVPRPVGIRNHTLFYAAGTLGEIIKDNDQTSDKIENLSGSSQLFGVDSNNNIMVKIYSQSGYYWKKVTNVASAGIGSISGPLSVTNLNVIRRKFLDRSIQNAFIEI